MKPYVTSVHESLVIFSPYLVRTTANLLTNVRKILQHSRLHCQFVQVCIEQGKDPLRCRRRGILTHFDCAGFPLEDDDSILRSCKMSSDDLVTASSSLKE